MFVNFISYFKAPNLEVSVPLCQYITFTTIMLLAVVIIRFKLIKREENWSPSGYPVEEAFQIQLYGRHANRSYIFSVGLINNLKANTNRFGQFFQLLGQKKLVKKFRSFRIPSTMLIWVNIYTKIFWVWWLISDNLELMTSVLHNKS